MISDATLTVGTTGTRTRINTLVSLTSLIARAISAEYAFGSARTVWVADIIGWANAIDGSVLRIALRIRSTWIRITRFRWLDDVWFD